MKEALLTIITKQQDDDLTFTTRTQCCETEEGIALVYEENLSDEDVVNTKLLIGDDSVMVERDGEVGGDMFFKKTTTYETKYNALGALSLDMKIFTVNLDISKDENGVSADIDYQLFVGGASVGKMGMNIKVEYV